MAAQNHFTLIQACEFFILAFRSFGVAHSRGVGFIGVLTGKNCVSFEPNVTWNSAIGLVATVAASSDILD